MKDEIGSPVLAAKVAFAAASAADNAKVAARRIFVVTDDAWNRDRNERTLAARNKAHAAVGTAIRLFAGWCEFAERAARAAAAVDVRWLKAAGDAASWVKEARAMLAPAGRKAR